MMQTSRQQLISKQKSHRPAFTLVELLVVIAIIGVLAAIVAPNLFKSTQKAKTAKMYQDIAAMKAAALNYYSDMGFLPPDVTRGHDPGFMKPLPYHDDTGATVIPSNPAGLPANWQDLVNANWQGPYLERWPNRTPWGGKYDWNLWPTDQTRNGQLVKAGVYVGVQGDRNNSPETRVPREVEQQMLSQGIDGDGVLNGEVQLLLVRLGGQ